ncbi:UNVERIFIED_CONTAM: hypothetical protein Scaly_0197600 [Sesamum calycinum]|uniref:Neprosin PEP catalytic domain-containing protein n=1 Tax=Sesamum calycinum TaxID=2727403 RepID=A0AAW2SZ51_9LAMI
MGSGHFPEEGFGKSSYIRNIQVVDESNNLRAPKDIGIFTEESSCYDVQLGKNVLGAINCGRKSKWQRDPAIPWKRLCKFRLGIHLLDSTRGSGKLSAGLPGVWSWMQVLIPRNSKRSEGDGFPTPTPQVANPGPQVLDHVAACYCSI